MSYIDLTAIDNSAFTKPYSVFVSPSLKHYTEAEQREGLVLGYLPSGILVREVKIIGNGYTNIYWSNKPEVKFNGVGCKDLVGKYLEDPVTVEFKGYLGDTYRDIFITIRYYELHRNGVRALQTPSTVFASDGTKAIRLK